MADLPHPILGVHETVLYASAVDIVVEFYAGVLGLEAFAESVGGAGRGLRLPSGAVVLFFDPEASGRPGRGVPSHGARGPGHVAFAIPPGSYGAWLEHLRACGVEIEKEIAWPADGSGGAARSIYFRDPAGNSVELMAGDYWQSVPSR
jgi:catechol 2,3-dioxygenase-like lactoylglutathione lyase family enzyme